MFNKELKIVSRIARLNTTASNIYRMLSDFSFMNNIAQLEDKVKIIFCDRDSCRIAVANGGEFGLRIIERQENSLIKITSDPDGRFDCKMWFQLKEVTAYDTRLRLTLHINLNPIMRLAAQKPLTNLVESIVTQLENKFLFTDYTYTTYEA